MLRRTLLLMLVFALAACSSPQTQSDDAPVETEVEDEEQVVEEEAEEVEETEEVAEAEESFEDRLRALAEGEHRAEGNAARNDARNPVETLLFFGLEPDMTVVELGPGAGWYTEILAPALSEGRLVVAYPDAADVEEGGYFANMITGFEAKLAENPEIYGNVERAHLYWGTRIELGEDASADMVLTFRSVHSWYGSEALDEVLPAVHAVLKPGGIFGVVAHRAADGAAVEDVAESGYMPQDVVIELIEAQGFELVEASEINANPADTHDHPSGVWSLPPTLRGGDEDRERFEAIGESDRMTLKFRKAETQP